MGVDHLSASSESSVGVFGGPPCLRPGGPLRLAEARDERAQMRRHVVSQILFEDLPQVFVDLSFHHRRPGVLLSSSVGMSSPLFAERAARAPVTRNKPARRGLFH